MRRIQLSMPDTVHRLPLERPEQAVREYAQIIRELRDAPAGAADLEVIATEAVETALRRGAVLLAVVRPPMAAPAVLTGVPLDAPRGWDTDSPCALREAMEDMGGPDVRGTVTLDTGLGPAVIAQRLPGAEQARDRRPLTLQLQAFVLDQDAGRMLLLTLASPRPRGWDIHQALFAGVVASAAPEGARRPTPVPAEESFEHHTYRL